MRSIILPKQLKSETNSTAFLNMKFAISHENGNIQSFNDFFNNKHKGIAIVYIVLFNILWFLSSGTTGLFEGKI